MFKFLAACFASRDVLRSTHWDAFAVDVFNSGDETTKSNAISSPSFGIKRARARKRLAINGRRTTKSKVKTPTQHAVELRGERTEASLDAMRGAMENNLLFTELDDVAKTRVMAAMTAKYVIEGEIVITQGDCDCDTFYIIEIGRAKVMKTAGGASRNAPNDSANESSGDEATKRGYEIPVYDASKSKCVATIGPGQGFGELALLYACPRSATIVAETSMKLWTLHASAFKTIKRSVATRDESSRLELLERVELFSALSEQQLLNISTAARRETYEANDLVFRQGDVGDCFYIIESGAAAVLVGANEVAKLGRADFFGERALINNEPRAATIVASTNLSCLVLNRKTFVSMLGSIEEARCFAGLADCPVLAPLSDAQLTDIAGAMKMQTFVENDVVFRENDKGDAFYVVIDGKFSVANSSSSAPLAEISRGQYFGELALLRNDKRSATIKCVSARAKVACMTKNAFEKKMGSLEVLQKVWRQETLCKVPMLSKLSKSEIQALAEELTDVSFHAGDVIIRQGDKGDAMFILESGEVEVVDEKNVDESGHPKFLCKLGPSSYFGELGLLNSDIRAATVRVPSRATVLIITRRAFEQHLGKLRDILKRNAEDMYSKGSVAVHKAITAKLEELKTIGFLGVGSFGKVSLVEYGGETFALKEIGKAQIVSRGLVDHVWREKQTMSQCDSPFLVNLRRTYVNEGSVFMLMDKVLGGELFTYLQMRNSPLPETHAKFYAACVVMAFEYLHDRQIIYRDLKPENLLIAADGYLKVTDFSFAKKLNKSEKTFTLCGTPQYLAPEQVQQQGHNRAVDWWALGVLIYELVNGVPPFNQDDDLAMYKAINDVKFHFSSRNDAKFRAVVLGFLRRMPASRLGMGKSGARDIKQHEWFADINWNALSQTRLRAPYVPRIVDEYDLRHFVDTDDPVPGRAGAQWGAYVSVGRFADF
jgi:cGMP-dependent protein kinase